MNTSIIDYALDSNWKQVGQEVKDNSDKFAIFFGAWVIGLGLTLLLTPFLLCCCICPWKCPIWNRKP